MLFRRLFAVGSSSSTFAHASLLCAASMVIGGCAKGAVGEDAGTSNMNSDSGAWVFPDAGTANDLGTSTNDATVTGDSSVATNDSGSTSDLGTTTDDAGALDGGLAMDSGTLGDAGATDSGALLDASATDSGAMDSGALDAGHVADSGAADTGVVLDSGAPDAGLTGVTCGGPHSVVHAAGVGVFTGIIDGYAANARTDCGNPSGNQSGTYFEFVAPSTGFFTIDTHGSAFDTVLTVYTACAAAAANDIVCNDDNPLATDNTSSITFWATSDTSYFVWLDTYDAAMTGAFVANITSVPGTTCGAAHPIIGTTGASILTAPIDSYMSVVRDDCQLGTGSSYGMYFEFVAPWSATFTIDTSGSAFDTVLAAYSACTDAPGSDIVCNDDAASGVLTSSLDLVATGGQSYFIWVDAYDDSNSGTFVVNIN